MSGFRVVDPAALREVSGGVAPAHGATLAAGTTPDSLGSLILMGGGAACVVLAVFGANLFMHWQRRRAAPATIDERAIEASASYRRYLAASAWTGGSTRNWDYSVRPVLAELVELTVARCCGSGTDVRAEARDLLGPELWSLVDREVRRAHDDSTAGAGRQTLLEILGILEACD